MLDVGCGDGVLTKILAELVGAKWDLVGVDPDPANNDRMIAWAKELPAWQARARPVDLVLRNERRVDPMAEPGEAADLIHRLSGGKVQVFSIASTRIVYLALDADREQTRNQQLFDDGVIPQTTLQEARLARDTADEELQGALDSLAALPGLDLIAVSNVYRTAPVGGPEQDDYLNAVVVGRTSMTPRDLLAAMERAGFDLSFFTRDKFMTREGGKMLGYFAPGGKEAFQQVQQSPVLYRGRNMAPPQEENLLMQEVRKPGQRNN